MRVESSGQDVDLVFDSTDDLGTVTVTYGGAASGTLSEGDFSETQSGSTYTYRADLSSGTDGTFWANTTTIEDVDGTPSDDTPLNDSHVVISGDWVWSTASHWDANVDERGVVHDSFGDRSESSVALGYPATDRGGSNLVGYWPLDGETGGPATDVARGNDGTHVDTPTQGSVGLHDTSAYTFDGDDEYLEVASTNRLSGGPNAKITASAWFYPHAPAGDSDWASLVGKEEDSWEGDWGLVILDTCPWWATNDCDGLAGDGTGPYVGYYGEDNDDYGLFYGPIQSGQWQHAAVVLDQPNDTVQLYMNGDLVAEDTNAPDDVSADTNYPVEIGATTYKDTWWRDPYFDGRIDDVRVYDRPLTGEEVGDLYNASGNGTFTTQWQTGNSVDPTSLELSYDVDIDAGERVNVTVVSDEGEESGVVQLSDGSGTVSIPDGGLSTNTDTYQLRVTINTTGETHSPEVHALSLEES
jgi:hypothetical protein